MRSAINIMSNPVSLYSESLEDIVSELSDPNVVGCERDPVFKNYLKDVDTDMYTMILSELYEKNRVNLKYHPSDRLLRVILWSWLDDAHGITDMPQEQAEEFCLDLAINPSSIRKLESEIMGFSPIQVAEAIFQPNDLWDDPKELVDYLDRWLSAFNNSKDKGKGLFYRIWI